MTPLFVLPGDGDYDDARAVWNGMHDRRPAVIVKAAGVADVLGAVRFGREHDLRIAVRGGGHNVAGNRTVEGGIVIDLGPMKGVRVDPRAQRPGRAGVTLGDLDRETEPFGLVVPIGVVTGTGVSGLMLGGGVGWLTRVYGLTIDSLLAADVVAADGASSGPRRTATPISTGGIRGGAGTSDRDLDGIPGATAWADGVRRLVRLRGATLGRRPPRVRDVDRGPAQRDHLHRVVPPPAPGMGDG
jgi:FAD/FMN-containing dehydrogenase